MQSPRAKRLTWRWLILVKSLSIDIESTAWHVLSRCKSVCLGVKQKMSEHLSNMVQCISRPFDADGGRDEESETSSMKSIACAGVVVVCGGCLDAYPPHDPTPAIVEKIISVHPSNSCSGSPLPLSPRPVFVTLPPRIVAFESGDMGKKYGAKILEVLNHELRI